MHCLKGLSWMAASIVTGPPIVQLTLRAVTTRTAADGAVVRIGIMSVAGVANTAVHVERDVPADMVIAFKQQNTIGRGSAPKVN